MPAGFPTGRWIAVGFGLGGILAAAIAALVWNEGFGEGYATAFLLDSIEQWKGRVLEPDLHRLETPSDPSNLAAPHEASATVESQYEARFSQEYFEARYYSATSSGQVSSPAAPFAMPNLGHLDDLHKSVPHGALTPVVVFPRADKLSVSVAGSLVTPPTPVWRLANTGPFHVFVTSESVSPTSSIETTVPASAFSAAPSVSSIGETAGSLLRKL